jgi:hypothetical protein
MLLVKRATKPLGIGSIVKITSESLNIYYSKKSGGFNDRLTDQRYIVLGKMNSCDQKIIRLMPIQATSYPEGNASHFRSSKKRKLLYVALSAVEDSKQSYLSIFGEEGRNEVQNHLLITHGINVTKV